VDVDDACKELRERGYPFNEAPFDGRPGGLVTLNDPDGNVIGFVDNTKGEMLRQT
jgi:hypothetical protein